MTQPFRVAGLALLALLPAFGQTAKPLIDHMVTASGFGGYPGVAAPGSWLEIYGSNLAGTTRSWATADFNGTVAPTSLDNVSVSVNGLAAEISYISPTHINLHVPDAAPVGSVPVIATYNGNASAAASLTLNTQQLGLLGPPSFNVDGKQYVVAFHGASNAFVSNGTIPNTSTAPALPGETIVLYGVGFGQLHAGISATPPTGPVATFNIGNLPAPIQYVGLVQGLVGLWQFNVVVPNGLPTGDTLLQPPGIGLQTLYISVGGPSVPDAPTSITATPGNGTAVVAFTAPTNNGGAAITKYTATCAAGTAKQSATGTTSPIIVTGLTNGTANNCTVTATNSAGTSAPSAAASVTPTNAGTFTLTSAAGKDGGLLPADYTCDGKGATIQLSWSNIPAGTQEFAILMTTLPGDGTTKWNWVNYHVPANITSLAQDSFLVGTLGIGSDGPGQVYNPPCSQGPGAKLYTWTIYALSGSPTFAVPAAQVTGQMVTDAISALKLGSATLNLSYSRPTNPTGSTTNCSQIINSTRASKSGYPTVACDGTYAYIGSIGIPTGPNMPVMMNGITSTNLQVPTPVNFQGSYGWKIPLSPKIAATPTSVVDGPLGVAINGVPIFNPCTQGGCTTGGDTKALGQLDICNGHAGRADDYHYHAAPSCMMADQPPSYWDTHPLGWALDGFAIFGYRDADGTTAVRDSICGGNTKTVPNAPAGYAYHVTDAPPYVTGCLAGNPSPDLPNQGSKYKPIRQPPVTPFNVSNMTLTSDPTDGYQVLQFTSAIKFVTNETGSDSYSNNPGTYKIRYKQIFGTDLAAQLAQRQNANASACWNFQFVDSGGKATQPTVSYCK